MPTVAASVSRAHGSSRRQPPVSMASGSSSTMRPPSATRHDPGPRLDRHVLRGRGDVEAARWLVWEASQVLGARSASIQELYLARGARRGPRVHRPGDQHPGPDLRHGPDDLRDGRGRRRRGGHPRARPERADVHLPATGRVRHERPRRGDRRGLARPGLHPGRPLPVQRREVRGRSREDDRGDPGRLPPGDRAWATGTSTSTARRSSTCPSRTWTRAARELRPGGRAHGAHPRARAGGGDDQRRRRDRRGRQAELDRAGAARLPRRLPARARRPPTGRDRDQQGERPDRARATAASRSRMDRSPRSSSTSRSSAGSARSPGRPAWPAASSTARARCPTSCSTTSRRSRRRRSTSRPASRTSSSSTRRSRPSSIAQIHEWCFVNALDERKTDQTDEQFVYSSRKKTIGPFKRSSGSSRPATRSWPRSDGRSPSCSPSSRSTDSRAMVDRYVRPVEEHRPCPASLAAVAAG